jgi:hypothetical protein
LNIDEPNPADTDDERVDDAAQPSDPPNMPVSTDDPPLQPGDSDLADAWWAR